MDILIAVLLILIIGLILFNTLRGDKSNEESEDFLKELIIQLKFKELP